MKDVYAEG